VVSVVREGHVYPVRCVSECRIHPVQCVKAVRDYSARGCSRSALRECILEVRCGSAFEKCVGRVPSHYCA
jgi:hypothetical protein